MGKTIKVVKNKKPSAKGDKSEGRRKPRVAKPKVIKDNITQTQKVVVNVGHATKPRAPRKPRAQKPQVQQQISVIRPPVISPPHIAGGVYGQSPTSVYNPPSIFTKDAQKEVNQLSELIKSLQTQKVVDESKAKPNALEKTKPKIKPEVEENEEQFEYDKLVKAERKKSLKGQVEEPFKEVQTTSLLGELTGQPNFPSFVKNLEDERDQPKESSAVKPSKYKSALSALGLQFGLTPFSLENPEPSGSLIDRLASEARAESLSVVIPKLGGRDFPPLKVAPQIRSLLESVEQPIVFEEARRQPQAELEVEPAFTSVIQAPTQEGELDMGFSLVPSAASGDNSKGMARGLTELNLGEQPTEPPPPEPPPYEGSAELPPVEQQDLRAFVKKAQTDVNLFPVKGQGLAEQVEYVAPLEGVLPTASLAPEGPLNYEDQLVEIAKKLNIPYSKSGKRFARDKLVGDITRNYEELIKADPSLPPLQLPKPPPRGRRPKGQEAITLSGF